jgi:hypothetical protein
VKKSHDIKFSFISNHYGIVYTWISAIALLVLEELDILVKELQELCLFDCRIEDAPYDCVVKDGLDNWSFSALFNEERSIDKGLYQIGIEETFFDNKVPDFQYRCIFILLEFYHFDGLKD